MHQVTGNRVELKSLNRSLQIPEQKQVESKTSQFEIVFKSLAGFSTQHRVKEIFKLLLAI